jgi:hypothetical protein
MPPESIIHTAKYYTEDSPSSARTALGGGAGECGVCKDGAIMRSTGLRVFPGLRDRLAFTSETSARASPYSLDMEKAETP